MAISKAVWKKLVIELEGCVTDETIRQAVATIRKQYSVSPLDLVSALKYYAHMRYPKSDESK